MGTSLFDPRVKQTHSRLQAMVLIALRNPLTVADKQDQHLEEDLERVNDEDERLLARPDYDVFAEEGFDVDD